MAAADIELARLAIADRHLADAEKFATEALHVRPNYADAQLLLARTYLMQRNAAKAEPIVLALAKAQPDSPVVKADMGELELLKKNQAGARKAFDAAIQQNPTQLSAVARLVSMDLQEHRTAAARERLDAAVRAAPRNAPLLVMAARFYLRMGDMGAAERTGKQALEADSSNLEVYSLLGSLYLSSHRLDDAIVEFTNAAKVQRRPVGPYTAIGLLLEMQRRPAEARARYEQALSLDPHAAVAANNLAWIYMDQGGSLDEALKLAKTAKEGLPNRPEVADTLAWAFYRLGQFSQAVTPLLDATAKDPSNPTYHYHLGMVYVSLSQAVKARPGAREVAGPTRDRNRGGRGATGACQFTLKRRFRRPPAGRETSGRRLTNQGNTRDSRGRADEATYDKSRLYDFRVHHSFNLAPRLQMSARSSLVWRGGCDL